MLRRLLFFLSTKRRGGQQTASLTYGLSVQPLLSCDLSMQPLLSCEFSIQPLLSFTLLIFPLDAQGTPMASQNKIVRRSTHTVRFLGLKNENTGGYITDATCRVTIYDPSGVAVAGATNLSAAHVTGTTGAETAYEAIVPSTVDFATGNYTVRGTATDTSSNVRERNIVKAPVDG